MPEQITLYRVFIATPGGLEQERQLFAKTLRQYNLLEAIPRQAEFLPIGWEDTLAGVGRPQARINEDLDRCDYFVMVLWDRWGTPPGGEHPDYTSGTEEEYRRAMDHVRDPKHQMREVVVLFKRIEDARRLRDPGEQLKKVLRFKEELEANRSLLFSTFGDAEEFERTLRQHLGGWLRDHDLKSTNRAAREAEIPQVYTAPGLVMRAALGRESARGGSLEINIFSGNRQPVPQETKILFTVHNGHQQVVVRNYFEGPRLVLTGLPFFNNVGDNYSVLAFAEGYTQAGFTPVRIFPDAATSVDLMLVGKAADFNFRNAGWDSLCRERPHLARLLASGAGDSAAAKDRYLRLMEGRPGALACFFNLATALSQMQFLGNTALDCFRELIWDDRMSEERFFAWADDGMVEQIADAASLGLLAPEPEGALFHAGATRSWKQIQVGEANVQLSVYENDRKTVDGTSCLMVEVNFDYYRDLAAHALLEIVANTQSGSLTDPRQVYVLRWIAGRHAGVPEFDPPYFVD